MSSSAFETTSPVTVSALTTHIRMLVDSDDALRDVWVTGEVSNWKRAASGHAYYRLKDGGATINAIMWRNSVQASGWLPREGDQVIAHGYVSVYPEGGNYQLYTNRLQPAGRGELYARFEALKTRLEGEGLFAEERKRAPVEVPMRLAIVTSPDAAALRDILRVLSMRWPMVDVVLFPTLVQGAEAPQSIAAAIDGANRYHASVAPIDTLILTRGGGSIEDLWAFNDEQVAYAIAASTIPVVSGVGHETDFTIADFVADVRAPTPSAAAAAVTPDRMEIIARLEGVQQMLQQQATGQIQQALRELFRAQGRLRRLHPQRQVDMQRQRLDVRERRLTGALQRRLVRLHEQQVAAVQRLESLNPARVLGRGYSIVRRLDGTVITAPAMVAVHEQLDVRSAGGDYSVRRIEADSNSV